MKKIIVFVCCLIATICLAEDTGFWGVYATTTGTNISVKVGNNGCNSLTVYNRGTNDLFGKINSTASVLTNAIADGSGCVKIAAGENYEWRGYNIASIAIATEISSNLVDAAGYKQ